MEDLSILLGLLIVGAIILLFVAFPIYTLVRLEMLAGQIRELQWRWSQLSAGKPVGAPSPETQAASAPPLYPPTPAAAPVSPPLPAEPQPVLAPSAAETTPPASAPAVRMPDLETLLGANWLARLGIAAIAAATAFFLQYAFRSGWIGPPAQVGIGLFTALFLLATGQILLPKPRYRNYAQALASGGIVVYFLSLYAAYSFYEPRLIGYTAALGALAVGALAASALAIRNRTEAVAVLCILGAFAAPVLIRQEGAGAVSTDSLVRLYAYLAALNVWVAILTRLRSWHSLAVVSFLSTWIIFFFAGPLEAGGWRVEAFAALYMLFSSYMGARALYAPSEEPGKAAEPDAPKTLSPARIAGVALVTGGCLAFMLSSLAILSEAGVLGLPDYTLAGVLAALLFAGLATALPKLPHLDREVRLLFGALSAFVLAGMTLFSLNATLDREQVPAAFAFTQFSYLLFLGVALMMNRREEEKAAAVLAGVNAFLHLMMTCRVLDGYLLWGAPAASLSLPLSAAVTACAIWIAARQRKEPIAFSATLAVSALILPAGGLLAASLAETQPPLHLASAIYAGEFLLISLLWIALRRQVAWSAFRAEIFAPIVNAAVFFGLLTGGLGFAAYRGFTLLCGAALTMAAYHAILGGVWLRREEPLHRLTYSGLSVTFLTIAIPLQLRAGYVTLAWAAEAAVLLWTGFAARELRVRWFALSLLTLAAGRALLFDLPNLTEPVRLLLNERMLGGGAVVAAICASAWMLWKNREKLPTEERILPALLAAAANLFALLFLSVDLWDYAGARWGGAGQANAPQLALSLLWTLYALAAISAGIWRRVRPLRLFAIALLYLSILKVFLFDLSWLEQPYRIVSFFTLGVILLLVSLLYTRFEERLRDGKEEPPATPKSGATSAGHPAG